MAKNSYYYHKQDATDEFHDDGDCIVFFSAEAQVEVEKDFAFFCKSHEQIKDYRNTDQLHHDAKRNCKRVENGER